MRATWMSVLSALVLSLVMACGTVGKRFDSMQVKNIKQGVTKKSDILEMFGLPFKEGQQNGQTTWTYEHHLYSALESDRHEDLVVLFDNNDVVQSYRYTTSAPK